MNTIIGGAWGVALALLGMSLEAGAIDLKVRPFPLTDQAYERLDLASVGAEGLAPPTEWLERVGAVNTEFLDGLTVVPVATIEVSRLDPDEPVKAFGPLVLKGREEAASVGANVIYPERFLYDGQETCGLRFIAYRITCGGHLVTPAYLEALTQGPVYAPAMDADLAVWETQHLGRTQVVMKPADTSANSQLPQGLNDIRQGAPVRVMLRDGSEYQGTYDGTDEDEIWVRPEGWIGMLTDHSFTTENVLKINVLN